MDPSAGRRPDVRSTAYESIFGRPTSTHHQQQPNQAPYGQQGYSQWPASNQYPSSDQSSQHRPYNPQQHLGPNYQYQDRRTSYAPSIAASGHSVHSNYSQHPSYAGGQQQPGYHQPQYLQPQQGHFPPQRVSSFSADVPPRLTPSPRSSSLSPASYAPAPSRYGEPSTQPPIYSGLTPAQAYQAEYQQSNSWSSTPNHTPPPSQPQYQTTPPNHNYNHQPSRQPDNTLPQVNTGRFQLPTLEVNEGRLSLDGFLVDDEPQRSNSISSIASDSTYVDDQSLRTTSTDLTTLASPAQYSGKERVRRNSGASEFPLQTQRQDSQGSVASRESRRSTLQVNTSLGASSTSTSPAPSLPSTADTTSSFGRRSSDSARTMPHPMGPRERVMNADRSRSLSATIPTRAPSLKSNGASSSSPLPVASSSSTPPVAKTRKTHSHQQSVSRTPVVYPALLSRVAEAFRMRVSLSERVKDGLAYKDSFDGREAVDQIAYIIKTTDRNLALLLGRALDAQKFFHDVTYDHRLRDTPHEIYQFRTRVPSPFVSGEDINGGIDSPLSPKGRPPLSPGTSNGTSSTHTSLSGSSLLTPSSQSTAPSPISAVSDARTPRASRARASSVSGDEIPLPSGVFTLLTECYSPTCTRDALCYSIACPRRLEQQARLNMKPQPGLKRSISRETLDLDLKEAGTLWIHSVPQEIVDSVSDMEKKRQEAINEVMYTERDFLKGLEYLRDSWMKPLQTLDVIPDERRTDFIQQVFWNIPEIIAVNSKLRDALNRRQKQYAVVEAIGDIFLDVVPFFEPFVKYGSHQLYGKYEFEKEKSNNPVFAQFVEETERAPEASKLELNGYLTKPTTRLARYPLLLEVVFKYTPDDNPDKADLRKVITLIKEFLSRVNTESGKAENRFNLLQLDQQLVPKTPDLENLRLRDENRELIYKGTLKKRGGTQGDSGDLQIFLLDHALLILKPKGRNEQYKVYRRPIPLELLVVPPCPDDDKDSTKPGVKPPTHRPKSTLMKRNSFNKNNPPILSAPARTNDRNGFSITFNCLGRKAYSLTLWASTFTARKKWLEHIQKQQELLRERSTFFDALTLSEGFFTGRNKVNCAAPFYKGRRVAYGTSEGVYFADLKDHAREPIKVLAIADVMQVDILEEYQLLIVLAERDVITFPLEALDPNDPTAGLKRAKRVASHTSFFKAGICLGRMLVCVVKSSPLSSTIKTLEPIDSTVRGKNKPTFKKLLQGGNDTLRLFKEFYIPTESSSIHFLKTKLCVGCTKGFHIVDLETLDTQGLLDPADTTLEFAQKRDNVRPIAIYRIDSEFLLCYDEFAFYVNKNGWRARHNWIVHWEGVPTAFALHYPYVIAFDPGFVEIRHVETGQLVQVIQGNGLQCLFAETPPSTTNSANMSSATSVRNGYASSITSGRTSFGSITQPRPSPQQMMYPGMQGGGMPYNNMQGQHAPGGMPHMHQSPPPPPQIPFARIRDDIILVSDDRVMALQLGGGLSRSLTSVTASSVATSVTTLPVYAP